MNERLTAEQLRQLSVAERLKLIEDVWLSLEETPGGISVPEWHCTELDARLASHERDPASPKPWSEVKEGILDLLRK